MPRPVTLRRSVRQVFAAALGKQLRSMLAGAAGHSARAARNLSTPVRPVGWGITVLGLPPLAC